MTRRTGLGAVALTIAVLFASSCDSSPVKHTKPPAASTTTTAAPYAVTPTREITVTPLLVVAAPNGHNIGGNATISIGIRPSTDHRLRVVFTETAVGGTAARWEAAGRSAVAVATLLTGAPLAGREFDFNVTGRADGVSAGALMTVAVIALIRGDVLENDVTMTGTIDPDGTIGPVGGIADEIAGASAAHKSRMLIPAGQQQVANDSGRTVDVVAAGRAVGVQVSAVTDVYDAYQQFTGKVLARLPASTETRLDERAYARLHGDVASWLSRFAASTHDFLSLAPEVQQAFGSYAATAARDAQDAKTLGGDGADAGAFRSAVSAAALMSAIAQTGRVLPVLLSRGAPAFVARVQASQPLASQIRDVVGRLGSFAPRSVSDADALMSAYRDAIDAMSLSTFSGRLFATPGSTLQAINDVAEGAVYFFVAGTLAEAGGQLLAAGRDLGGPALQAAPAARDAASLLRGAAQANLAAFQSDVLVPTTLGTKSSLESAERAFAAGDLDYALAQVAGELLAASPSYFGAGTGATYAALAGALAFYDRTARLLATYDGLGRIDPKSQHLSGIGDAAAFNTAIGAAQTQLASSIGSLRSKGVNPGSAVAGNELAGRDRVGDASDQFDALGEYWNGFVSCRVLAYLGGFSGL